MIDSAGLVDVTRLVSSLRQFVAKQMRQQAHTFEIGTVTSTDPLMVTLDIAQSPSPCSRDVKYAPNVGDRVLLARFRRQLCILCAFTTP